jgi:hypothetical protein
MLARGADTGGPLRVAATDYPVHETAHAAIIAADVVPSNQVAKMFSPEISKQYVVVEVAIYPGNGAPFDMESVDFAMRVGQRITRADRPSDVAPWPEGRDAARRLLVDVTTETGVIYQRSNDSAYGRQQSVGTYTGVAVSGAGQQPAPRIPRLTRV